MVAPIPASRAPPATPRPRSPPPRPRPAAARADPGPARGPPPRLPVVPRARRDDAGGPFLRRQRRKLVDDAADLEGPRPLQVLGLQEDAPPRPSAERLGGVDGRDPGEAGRGA